MVRAGDRASTLRLLEAGAGGAREGAVAAAVVAAVVVVLAAFKLLKAVLEGGGPSGRGAGGGGAGTAFTLLPVTLVPITLAGAVTAVCATLWLLVPCSTGRDTGAAVLDILVYICISYYCVCSRVVSVGAF